MITSDIDIALDDKRRWFIQWRCPDGVTRRDTFGSRKSLTEALPAILSDVLGTTFPSITEEITINAPRRRVDDTEKE